MGRAFGGRGERKRAGRNAYTVVCDLNFVGAGVQELPDEVGWDDGAARRVDDELAEVRRMAQRGEKLLLIADVDLPRHCDCRGIVGGEGGGQRGVGWHEGREAESHRGGGRKSAKRPGGPLAGGSTRSTEDECYKDGGGLEHGARSLSVVLPSRQVAWRLGPSLGAGGKSPLTFRVERRPASELSAAETAPSTGKKIFRNRKIDAQ